jgi:hypothetical protein
VRVYSTLDATQQVEETNVEKQSYSRAFLGLLSDLAIMTILRCVCPIAHAIARPRSISRETSSLEPDAKHGHRSVASEI